MDSGTIRQSRIITEISRTDATKRKGLLVDAFTRVAESRDDLFLVLAVADAGVPESDRIRDRISRSPAGARIACVGSIPELLPSLYAASAVYSTPVAKDGVLYVLGRNRLYALEIGAQRDPSRPGGE